MGPHTFRYGVGSNSLRSRLEVVSTISIEIEDDRLPVSITRQTCRFAFYSVVFTFLGNRYTRSIEYNEKYKYFASENFLRKFKILRGDGRNHVRERCRSEELVRNW